MFTDSGQLLGFRTSTDVALGDLDRDGDLDAYVTNFQDGNRVLLNQDGTFSDIQQSLGDHESTSVALGDLDGDGDIDAFVTNGAFNPQGNRVWLNDGTGSFSDSGQSLGNDFSIKVALGDLDGDGDLDAFGANVNVGNRVWLNNGGLFTDSGQSLGSSASITVSLGDLDNDGDLDAFVANAATTPGGSDGQANRVWLNNAGIFSDSGQVLGNHLSNGVSLGDLDDDGDLDAFVVNFSGQGNRVWLNNAGIFSDSGESLGNQNSRRVELGDVDSDGDLDAFVTNGPNNRVWLNNGGQFSDSGQSMTNDNAYGAALGDVDGDGDLDAFVANFGGTNRVWADPQVDTSSSLAIASIDGAKLEGNAGNTTFTFAVTRSGHLDAAVSVQYAVTGSGAKAADAADFGGTSPSGVVNFAVTETEQMITINVAGDMTVEADEEFTVTLSNPTPADTEITAAAATGTIQNDDQPPSTVTLQVDNAAIPEAAGVATFTATLSAASTLLVTVDLGISGTAAASDYTASGTQTVIAAGATSGSVSITAVEDGLDEPDETVIVDVTSVTNGQEAGTQQATTTILDDDKPLSFAVTSLNPTDSGFQIEFNGQLDDSEINLYDTPNAGLGTADVVVTGATSGAIAGSLVVNASSLEFIKSGGPLVPDTYTVTLHSASDGFKDSAAMLLDGNGDGTGGDNYVGNFTVAEAPAGARTVSIPDFVRGPGQDVNLPADTTTGIPITISEGDNVRAADLRISYDPALLEITGATAPVGGTVVVNTTTPGLAILVYASTASLPVGSSTFVNLQATVPTANASANYGSQQVLDVHEVVIRDGNDNEFPVVVDDAVHFATFFADTSGNGRINASDAAQVARFAALIDSGFAASLNTDPTLVGDISGNGRINAADASRVAQFAALIEVPEIPPIPAGVAVSGGVHLGPGLSDLKFPALGVALATSQGTGVQSSEVSLLPGVGWDPYQAVDTVMTSMVMLDDDAAKRLTLDLEDAMAELLTAELLAD